MDLSVKRIRASGSPNNHHHHRHANHQRSHHHGHAMTPASIVNSLMPQLIKSDLIKKEFMENHHENDRMSEKSDDSSDSGRLQMDISAEDNDEFKNLPLLKPIERGTPESNFSDEHNFEGELWQALAQHSQCELWCNSLSVSSSIVLIFEHHLQFLNFI